MEREHKGSFSLLRRAQRSIRGQAPRTDPSACGPHKAHSARPTLLLAQQDLEPQGLKATGSFDRALLFFVHTALRLGDP